jgi:hypothetical protein
MIYALKKINSLSLSFALLGFIATGFGYKGDIGVIFVSTCLMFFLTNLIKVRRVGSALKIVEGLSYYYFLDQFRKGIYICLALFIFSLLSFNFRIFESVSALYIIIYLVSSVILLRTLRFLEYNKDNKIVNRLNSIYSITMILSAFVLSLDYVRHAMVKAIAYVYSSVIDIIFYIFWWLIYSVGIAILSILRFLMSLGNSSGSDKQQITSQGNQGFNISNEHYKSLLEVFFNNYFIGIFLKVVIVCLAIYILYRMLYNMYTPVKSKEEYVEDREFIFSEKKANSLIKEIVNFLKSKNEYENIRYYYRKFMKLCIDKKLQIEKSDTTEDINRKSRNVFDKVNLEEFRNIYIKARYGDSKIDRDMVEKIISHYKNLK